MEQKSLMSESYERHEHSVGISLWHFEWCTKYRYRIFQKEETRALLAACIRRAAFLHGIKLRELNVQPEHVHCVAALALSMSPSTALQILKGISARLFFAHKEKARLRYPRGHLWSRGKFAASLGFVQVDIVQTYVRNQDIHHAHASGNRTL